MNFSNRKQVLFGIAMVAMLVLAGCAETNESDNVAKEIGNDTGNDIANVTVGGSYVYEVRMTEKNHIDLVKGQPPFKMDSSLERANLIRRYQYLNDKNNVHHVYLMSNDGKVIAYFVAQGKVSSVNSKLTNGVQIVRSEQCEQEYSSDDKECYFRVESPQMDGSYGENGDAIFFFTTDGKYVEWNGKYVVSEEPLNIQTSISLEQQVDEDGDDASENSTDT